MYIKLIKQKKWLVKKVDKIFYYIFKNHILLEINKTLKAAIEKCCKPQVFLKTLFYV